MNPPKKTRTKSAYADEHFYYQLQAGGDRGWNERHIDPNDTAKGIDRFYLKYYNAIIASIELIEKDDEIQTKITVFGSPEKVPVPQPQAYSEEDWNHFFHATMEAIQNLYQA